MSFASGSISSSSRVESLRVVGDFGIAGEAVDAADTLAHGCELVSGAIVRRKMVSKLFTLGLTQRGLGFMVRHKDEITI